MSNIKIDSKSIRVDVPGGAVKVYVNGPGGFRCVGTLCNGTYHGEHSDYHRESNALKAMHKEVLDMLDEANKESTTKITPALRSLIAEGVWRLTGDRDHWKKECLSERAQRVEGWSQARKWRDLYCGMRRSIADTFATGMSRLVTLAMSPPDDPHAQELPF